MKIKFSTYRDLKPGEDGAEGERVLRSSGPAHMGHPTFAVRKHEHVAEHKAEITDLDVGWCPDAMIEVEHRRYDDENSNSVDVHVKVDGKSFTLHVSGLDVSLVEHGRTLASVPADDRHRRFQAYVADGPKHVRSEKVEDDGGGEKA